MKNSKWLVLIHTIAIFSAVVIIASGSPLTGAISLVGDIVCLGCIFIKK